MDDTLTIIKNNPSSIINIKDLNDEIVLLALKNGYILNLAKVSPKETLEASIISIVDTEKLENIIQECLEEKQ